MSHIITSQPKANLGFFDNYLSHGLFLVEKHVEIFEQITSAVNPRVDLLTHECKAKLNFLTPFRDRYDLTDEVVGATLLPLVGVVISVSCAVWALKELFHMLAIESNLVNDDDERRGLVATGFAMYAVLAAAASLAALIKCSLSLLTRPIATLGNALFNSTSENPDQHKQHQSDEENRFIFTDSQLMSV